MAKAKKLVRQRSPRRPTGRTSGTLRDNRRHHIQAGEFKAVCLHLMEQVKATGEEFVITKRGQPVAKLAPLTDADLRPFVDRSRGVITANREDLVAPLGEDWEVDADL